MLITYEEPAPVDSVFAPDAFDSQVGKQVPFYGIPGVPEVTVVSVQVQPGGRSVLMTVDVPGWPSTEKAS